MARTIDRQQRSGFIARLGAISSLVGGLRGEMRLFVSLAVVVLLTSFALSAAPRLFNLMSDDAVRTAITESFAINRNLSIEQGKRVPPTSGDDPFVSVVEDGGQFLNEFPESLQSIVEDQQYLVGSPQFRVQALPDQPVPPFPRFLRLRQQQGIDAQTRLVDGRMPEPAGSVTAVVEPNGDEQTVPLFEIIVTRPTAEELELGIGDRSVLTPNTDDPLYRGIPITELHGPLMFEIVGIFEAVDPDAEYWFGDSRLLEPVVVESADFVLIFAEGLMAPADYERLLAETDPALWNYQHRYFVDPDRIDAGEVGQIMDDIRRTEVLYGASAFTDVDQPQFRTGLVRIMDRYLGQRQLTMGMLSMAVVGAATIAGATLLILTVLIADRRRTLVMLVRSRGASATQLLGAGIVEGVIISLPAVLAGYFLADLIVPGRTDEVTVALAVVVLLAAVALLILSSLGDIRRDLGALIAGQIRPGRSSPRRLVLEAGIVALAIVSVVLYRRRGLEAGSLSDPNAGFDPFLAAMPVILTVAVGLVVLRVYPLAARFFGWIGTQRRDLTVFVGFRRITRQPTSARLPVIILLLAVTIGTFAGIFATSIDIGQRESTWHQVGADVRLSSRAEDGPLTTLLDLSRISGIEAAADGYVESGIQIDATAPITEPLTILGVETREYAEVTRDTRADPAFPEAMLVEQNVQDIGTTTNPIPAIISSTWVDGAPPQPGDLLTIEVNRTDITFIVRDVRDRFPGLEYGEPFLVSSLTSLEQVDRDRVYRPTRKYLRIDEGMEATVRQMVREQSLGTEFRSRQDLYEDLANAPLVSGARVGLTLAAIVAAAYAVLAAIAALALTSHDRARDLGYLRTMGLSLPQALALTFIEQVPSALIAAVIGVAMGIGMVRIVEPGIDLMVFTGEGLPPAIVLDWWIIGGVAGALVVAVLGAVFAYSFATRRANLGDVLRLGE